MVVLLLLFGFMAVAAGVFGLGVGVPVKDTAFGAAVLASSSMAIAGGFILVGLALAVFELRRVLHAGLRQMRLPERLEAERSHSGRRMEPRIGVPGAPAGAHGGTSSADTADVIPTRFDAPETVERPSKPVREEWPPSDARVARGPATPPPPAFQPLSGIGAELRRASATPAPERFDAIRPSEYRKLAEGAPGQQVEAPLSSGTSGGDLKSPPLSPAQGAGSATIRPVRILKSGMINDVGYTLFSDGSIETQTPAGVLRFGSIDEFRRHLEQTD
jgi:hypothetical protein